jgi:hypothetical protein
MLAIMAGPDTIDAGQFLTHLFIYAFLQVIRMLIHDAWCAAAYFPVMDPPWFLRGNHRPRPCRRVKIKPNISKSYSEGKTSWGLTYLVPLGMATFRVGCRIEICLQHLRHLIGKPLLYFQALLS